MKLYPFDEKIMRRYCLKKRVPKYMYYWFISYEGRRVPMKCRDTEHPFDAERFENGNYFDQKGIGKFIADINERYEGIKKDNRRKK